MQSLDKRVTLLEAARAKERQLAHLTDAELDERIAFLVAMLTPMTPVLAARVSPESCLNSPSTYLESQYGNA